MGLRSYYLIGLLARRLHFVENVTFQKGAYNNLSEH